MIEFHQTRMGHKFYESDVPRIADALAKIATRLDSEATVFEAVWVATDVTTKKSTAYVSAQACRLALRVALEERGLTHLWSKCLDGWDLTSLLEVAMFHVERVEVSL